MCLRAGWCQGHGQAGDEGATGTAWASHLAPAPPAAPAGTRGARRRLGGAAAPAGWRRCPARAGTRSGAAGAIAHHHGGHAEHPAAPGAAREGDPRAPQREALPNPDTAAPARTARAPEELGAVDSGAVRGVCGDPAVRWEGAAGNIPANPGSGRLGFNPLPTLPSRVAQMEAERRIVGKGFLLFLSFNGILQHGFTMSYPRMQVCAPKCFKIYVFISHLDLYATQKNICSFNYFSKHDNGITNDTTEHFPFFKEYEPSCN